MCALCSGSNAWVRQLKVTLYSKIDQFASRYPEAIDEDLRRRSPKKAKPAKRFRKGKRASRRLRASEGADDNEQSYEEDSGEEEGCEGVKGLGSAPDLPLNVADLNGEVQASMEIADLTVPRGDRVEDLSDLGMAAEDYRDDRNPLHAQSYFQLPLRTRVIIVKALCDWQLETRDEEESVDRRDIRLFGNGKFAAEDLRVEPFGWDRHGHEFWYFDDGYRVYRERVTERSSSSPKNRRGTKRLITAPPRQWDTIATNPEELEAFLGSLNKKKHKVEAELRSFLAELLEEWRASASSLERAKARQEKIHLAMLDVKRSSRVQLQDQKKAEEAKQKHEAERIRQITREAAAERQKERARFMQQEQDAARQRLEGMSPTEIMQMDDITPQLARRMEKEAAAEQAKVEKRRAEKEEQERKDAEEAARLARLLAKKEAEQQISREERRRRRELGEAAPPPPKDLIQKMQALQTGDWVQIFYPDDGQWYSAEVISTTSSRVKVLYPESAGWAPWEETLRRDELHPDRIRFAAPEVVESLQQAKLEREAAAQRAAEEVAKLEEEQRQKAKVAKQRAAERAKERRLAKKIEEQAHRQEQATRRAEDVGQRSMRAQAAAARIVPAVPAAEEPVNQSRTGRKVSPGLNSYFFAGDSQSTLCFAGLDSETFVAGRGR